MVGLNGIELPTWVELGIDGSDDEFHFHSWFTLECPYRDFKTYFLEHWFPTLVRLNPD